MHTLTPEQEEDFNQRRSEFLEKYKTLIDEYLLDFVSFPVFTSNEKGSFDVVIQTQVMDKKFTAYASPFIAGK